MAWVLFAQQNTVKTANRNSRINFYFVTAFYSLYDICIAYPRTHKHKQVEHDRYVSPRDTQNSELLPAMNCFATSQMTMPAVTLTFKECLVPNCGISRQPSARSTTS